MVQDSSVADAVRDKEIALHFRREVSTGNHRAASERTRPLWVKGGKLIGGVTTSGLGDAAMLATAGVLQWIVNSTTQWCSPVAVTW